MLASTKQAIPEQHLDVVPRELRERDVDLRPDHVLHAEGKIGHRDLFLDAIIHAVNVLVVVAGKVEHRFPHCLARNGAGVDANAAHHFQLLHQRHFFARLGSLYRGSLSGRTRADHNHIERLHVYAG